MPKTHEKLVIIDGNSLLYRAFFALPMLTSSKGEVTNAVYGFTMMLYKIMEEQKPEMMAVSFDRPEPTFRHQRFEAYKATRAETPAELGAQVGMAKEVLEALRVPIFEMPGYEADDIIGTMADAARARGYQVLIVTGDLDELQLVSDRVQVMTTRRGVTDTVIYDEKAVRERFGLEPGQLPDYRALKGDVTDNIPGVPGVGEKTASRLIQEYGSLEALLEHLDALRESKVGAALEAHAEQARESKVLSLIVRDLPLDVDFEACRLREPDRERLVALFRRFEFKSLLTKIGAGDPWQVLGTGETRLEPEVIRTTRQAEALAKRLKAAGEFAFVVGLGEGGLVSAEPIGLAFAAGEGAPAFVALSPPGQGGEKALLAETALDPGAWRALQPLLGDARVAKFTHDLKGAHALCKRLGCALAGAAFDTQIASYLLNPARQSHDLGDVVLDHLQVPPPPMGDLPALWAAGEVQQVAHDTCLQAQYVWRLAPEMRPKIEEQGLAALLDGVELPLAQVLAEMELAGVAIDTGFLHDLSRRLEGMVAEAESKVYELAGDQFNIGSPKQLQRILFEKLNLPTGRRTKTGFSTSAEVLAELAPRHEIVAQILRYRELTKLKSTYVDALPRLVDPRTGRVHTSFNQTVTATGRLSSSEPNLQNIPIRTDLGKLIRKAFVAGGEGRLLLAADYSQIELRVLAHISQDEHLLQIFAADDDLHTHAACEIFGVAPAGVTSEMRRLAKVVNFGIPYGISPQGLAQGMGVPVEKARRYMEAYFERFPGIREYIEEVVERARQAGYVTTLLGRRRYLPDLHAQSRQVREFAQRTAINTPIQGSAADIIKLAMLLCRRRLREERLAALMTLQVHDELVFEVPQGELEATRGVVGEAMANAFPLCVPLKVEVEVGPNWGEMRPA